MNIAWLLCLAMILWLGERRVLCPWTKFKHGDFAFDVPNNAANNNCKQFAKSMLSERCSRNTQMSHASARLLIPFFGDFRPSPVSGMDFPNLCKSNEVVYNTLPGLWLDVVGVLANVTANHT